MSALLDAAFVHHAEGRPVIAVDENKRPYSKWKHLLKQLQSEEEVREQFVNGVYGIAVVLYPACKYTVLDFDGPHAKEAWQSTRIELPATARHATRSGGIHLYFKMPDGKLPDLKRKVRLVKTNCDCKHDGKPKPCGVDLLINGYAVIPPTPGYREDPDHPLEDAVSIPREILDLAFRRQKTEKAVPTGDADGKVRQGERKTTACSLAGTMRARGMSIEAIRIALKTDNQQRFDPPLEDNEIEDVLKSAAQWEQKCSDSTAELPKINAGDLNLARVADAAWNVLVAANRPPFLFRYGGLIARIEKDDQGAPVIRFMNENKLRYDLARMARWYTIKKTDVAEKDALPPLHLVRDMLARPEPPLPVLTRIVEAPVFASDGTLCSEPGYHERGRIFFAPSDAFSRASVPNAPSQLEIKQARELILNEALVDFPFVGASEKAHAVALMLLPFARELIDGPTPLHLIEKPTPGTGGTLLADTLLFPSIGREVSVMSEARDEDEWRKRIIAKLMRGPAVVVIDNLRRRLESAALSSAITKLQYEDRILGHSETVDIPVRCTWVATGNNPALSSEISRRTIRIRLDAKVDRPWLRESFKHPNLRDWVKENRLEIVRAALTLINAWIAAGRPEGKATLGMFEQWSRIMGGIISLASIDGFLSNLSDFYDQSDAEGEAWRIFLSRWWEEHGTKEVGVADLYPLASPSNDDPIDLGLGDGSERSQKIRLGKKLAEMRDRRFGEFRIVKAGEKDRAQMWQLNRTD